MSSTDGAALLRYGCTLLAVVFLIGALVSFVGLFDRIEHTTTLLAGASTAFAFLAYAMRRAKDG